MVSHYLLVICVLKLTSCSYGNEKNHQIYNDNDNLLQLNQNNDGNDLQEIKNEELLVELVETNVLICDDIIEKSCSTAKTLTNFKCANSKLIPVQKLCDGEPDCEDFSDEVNCYLNIMDKVAAAHDVMTKVIASVYRKCLPMEVNSLLTEEIKFHREVLSSPTKLFQNLSTLENPKRLERFIKTSNAVCFIISSIATTLDSLVCKLEDESLARSEVIYKHQNRKLSLHSCVRLRPSKDIDCFDAIGQCKHLCLQRFKLKSYRCLATNGRNSITLDELCNGNLDCFDETDEINCVAGTEQETTLEAINYYDTVLKIILNQTHQTKVDEYSLKHYNWLVLYDMARKMQEMATQTSVHSYTIKKQRDNIFDMLGEIYEKTLQSDSAHNVDSGTFKVLMSINLNLVEAMKRSHTGNELYSLYETCSCKNGDCTLKHCSRKCVRFCLVEPKLLRFPCSKDTTETVPTSVALNDLCNGKNDCQSGDDENDCANDAICRPSHFALLREGLTAVGNTYKDTSLSEVLEAWKTKAIQALLDGEREHKLSRAMFEQRIRLLLGMLVQEYASMESHKGFHDRYVLTEFEKIANVVMSALKLCRK